MTGPPLGILSYSHYKLGLDLVFSTFPDPLFKVDPFYVACRHVTTGSAAAGVCQAITHLFQVSYEVLPDEVYLMPKQEIAQVLTF